MRTRKECRCGRKRNLTTVYFMGEAEYRCSKCLKEHR